MKKLICVLALSSLFVGCAHSAKYTQCLTINGVYYCPVKK